MLTYSLRHELEDGYIHNWLVAGPQAIPVPDLDRFQGEDWKLLIARAYYEADSGVRQPPVQDEAFRVGDASMHWGYRRCDDDHFVDQTAFYFTCHYLKAWAYSRVVSPAPHSVNCLLTTNGPADVWLNGQHIHRHEHFHHQIPRSVTFQAELRKGQNEFLVRFVEVAARECPFAMALRLSDVLAETFVSVPTSFQGVARRQTVEDAIYAAYLDRDVFVWDDEITVHWPKDMTTSTQLTVRLQQPSNWIYSEGRPTAAAGVSAPMAMPYQAPEGQYRVALLPSLREYYEGNLRIEREIPLTALHNRYSQAPYGTLDERRAEALNDAARREGNVFSEIAKMALHCWTDVSADLILKCIEGINQRKDCSDFYLVGLLGMAHRYGHQAAPGRMRAQLQVLGGRAGQRCHVVLVREPPDPVSHLRDTGWSTLPGAYLHEHRSDRAQAPGARRTEGAFLAPQAGRWWVQRMGLQLLLRGGPAGSVTPC
jgi:hypothetical protein